MQDMSLWGIAAIVGPIVLLLLFAFAFLRNRASRAGKDAERAMVDGDVEERAERDDAV